ncbi:hypothetical protein C2G38_2071302 [Gigaspora rosea]|uniref:Peptidase S1 domain-containing protein n=1 Tax=Gigaspora rosea TaxID=44941 RepID=A0A397VPT8_9GLOM|nr:hypothetical protein C2G38_2071302 [Gigaspora rosea]
MKYIYFLLILFTFQRHLMVIHAQEHPLAELWGIQDHEIPSYLSREANLIEVLEILSIPEVKQYEQFLDFRKANNSLAYLKSSFNEITKLAKQNNPLGIFVSIFPKFNNIVIVVDNYGRNVSEEEDLEEYIRSVSQYKPEVFFADYPSNSLNSLTSSHTKRGCCFGKITERIFCGQGIINEFDGNICSAGFFAKNQSHTFLVTAGHCNKNYHGSGSEKKFFTFEITKRELIGKLVYSSTAPHDIALIDIEQMSKHLRPSTGIINVSNVSYVELFINDDGMPVFTHGAHLCKAGYSSSVTCGYTEAFNGFYLSGLFEIRENYIFVDIMKSFGGDSGGPVFAFTDLNRVTLNGILSGSLKDRSPVSPFNYIVPLEIILKDNNLNLITDPIVPQ